MKSIRSALGLLALASLSLGPSAYAQKQVSASFGLPVQVQAKIVEYECENNPGPYITFEGAAVMLQGLGVQLIFRNNINKDVHTRIEEVAITAVVISPGETIVIPKQPVRGGVGGNPFIWVQIIDANGNPLSGEIFIGRCVQGPVNVSPTVLPVTAALANIEALDCTNNKGPFIYVSGQLGFPSGVKARFIFRNNDNPVGGPHEAVVTSTVDASIIPPNFTLQSPKQPVQGGVGGNPWISVRFTDAKGNPITNEALLGRCVQLQPGN